MSSTPVIQCLSKSSTSLPSPDLPRTVAGLINSSSQTMVCHLHWTRQMQHQTNHQCEQFALDAANAAHLKTTCTGRGKWPQNLRDQAVEQQSPAWPDQNDDREIEKIAPTHPRSRMMSIANSGINKINDQGTAAFRLSVASAMSSCVAAARVGPFD